MFNNRMLAVAAVLVMAVPALGAATPIVVPPVPEQLVEGHTVFTVIEIVRATATNETRFAAAVAVLVREYQDERVQRRFPGVLWFNDQYLVNPSAAPAQSVAFRYPCGGAVMAVNAGDPDPRMVIARITAGTPGIEADGQQSIPGQNAGAGTIVVGDDSHTYTQPPWSQPAPGTYYYGQPGAPTDYAWVGADPAQSTINVTDGSWNGQGVWTDTVVGAIAGSAFAGFDYNESYLITDPNDHVWIIDKYDFYTRDTNAGSGVIYQYPVWVVNILGSPVFMIDQAPSVPSNLGQNCSPYKDLVENAEESVNAAWNGADSTCGARVAAATNDSTVTNCHGVQDPLPNKETATCGDFGTGGMPPYTDDPCMGYAEPSRNGYCYGGQSAAEGCYHGPTGNCNYNTNYRRVQGAPEVQDCPSAGPEYRNTPLRQYNALLYFKLHDLRIAGADRDHSDPVTSGDTNGCASEGGQQAAYDWPCPGGDDNAEGNSHPFHPSAAVHGTHAQMCPSAFYGSNPTNHGGSTYAPYGGPMAQDSSGEWWNRGPAGSAPCDFAHATRNIDVYFSPGGRPFVPPVRNFVLIDLEGSSAPFQDYHCAYGTGTCPTTP